MVVPNYNMHPLFKKAVQGAKVVTLRAGDALFIPEGWYELAIICSRVLHQLELDSFCSSMILKARHLSGTRRVSLKKYIDTHQPATLHIFIVYLLYNCFPNYLKAFRITEDVCAFLRKT